MARRPDWRRIKSHRCYAVNECAEVLGVHKNTLRAWIKDGLPVLSAGRPLLILGVTLKAFLEERYAKRKQPLKPGEMYCVACKSPKHPAEGMADLVEHAPSRGQLQGLCPSCGGLMRRFVNANNLGNVADGLDVHRPSTETSPETQRG